MTWLIYRTRCLLCRCLHSLPGCSFQLLQILCQRLFDSLTFFDMGAQDVHVSSRILVSYEGVAIGLAWNDFLDFRQRRAMKFCLQSQGAGNQSPVRRQQER